MLSDLVGVGGGGGRPDRGIEDAPPRIRSIHRDVRPGTTDRVGRLAPSIRSTREDLHRTPQQRLRGSQVPAADQELSLGVVDLSRAELVTDSLDDLPRSAGEGGQLGAVPVPAAP